MRPPTVRSSSPGVARLTLDDPGTANALTGPAIARLARELDEAAAAPAVRVAVLGHTGGVFCSGAHLGGADDGPAALVGLLGGLWSFPKPLVAVVGGAARGAGVALAALADLVVAADDATFAAPEVRLGLPPTVLAPVLEATIGAAAATDLLLTGRVLDAGEARAVGLVHRIGSRDELAALTDRVLDELRRGAPAAQRAAKWLLRAGRTAPLHDALTAVAARPDRLVDPAEAAEGLAAFRARRLPEWSVPDDPT